MGTQQRNESEDMLNKAANLTINVGNENDIIKKVANMTINDVKYNLNQENASDVQVQFADDPARKTHQILLIGPMIRIRHEEIPVLYILTYRVLEQTINCR